ncbi:MAG: HEAT repeat domain-containing protein, partial [Pseudohongiellaceae bacterium]
VSDQNPGVRYQAVQALVNLTHEERVRDALRYALQQDVNQGVRVEAFNALAEYRDPQTLQVFREQMENDSNEYIRTQARSIVESVDSDDQDTFIY